MWLVVLSDQLPVAALVSHYLTNKLIGRGPIRKRLAPLVLRPYYPGGTLIALASARKGLPPTPSVHRLQLGLPGYLIPFATLAFVHERQHLSRILLTP